VIGRTVNVSDVRGGGGRRQWMEGEIAWLLINVDRRCRSEVESTNGWTR
jgi:hypothetical protein